MPIDLSDVDAEFAMQYKLLCANISTYETILSIDEDDVTELKAVNDYIQLVFVLNIEVQAFAHSFTSYKKQLHFGPSKGLLGSMPQAPVFPTVPVAVTNGNAKALNRSDLLIHDAVPSLAICILQSVSQKLSKTTTATSSPSRSKPMVFASLRNDTPMRSCAHGKSLSSWP